jgi:hypothetical protein
MVIWRTFFKIEARQTSNVEPAEGSHIRSSKFKVKKSAQNGQYYLQRADILVWMDSTTLSGDA